MPLRNVTIGNPYVNPHVSRPYDDGPYPPPEHPFAGVARLCRCVSEIKRAVPGAAVVVSSVVAVVASREWSVWVVGGDWGRVGGTVVKGGRAGAADQGVGGCGGPGGAAGG